ncbi:MAG TPA: DNA cytosine methyltransferase [Candidatus Aphodovivens avicola]|nr:DNA cytosine methyltransferase [Candidatus Aphodovivens avicola]
MKYASLFSGIEAASVAWEPLGWEPLAFSEIDPFCCAVLAERFQHVPNLGDVSNIDWKKAVRKHGKPDLVVGGSPCQSFSVAGKREGFSGASGLMWEYVRAVRDVKPDWVVWENVPGALSSSHGEDFRCLLEALDALGYGLAWRVLDAQFFGVAQRRERLFLVGRLGDPDGPCKVLFEPESLRWDHPSSREKREELASRTASGVVRPDGKLNRSGQQVICLTDTQAGAHVSGELCGTLTAHASKDAPVVSQYGEVAGTLTARFDSSPCVDRGQTIVVMPFDTTAITSPANGSNPRFGDPNSTLCASKHTPTVVIRNGISQTVRRLTPRECERLQGFPDDWTRVPYRGKPTEECPDTPRYKAIGNSMAVPVMRWIGERIEAAERGE